MRNAWAVLAAGAAACSAVPAADSDAAVVVAGEGLCTGVVVDPRLVLTAAHCVDASAPPVDVVIYSTTTGESREVERVLVHPFYSRETLGRFDVAALVLRSATSLPAATVETEAVPEPGDCDLRLSGIGGAADGIPELRTLELCAESPDRIRDLGFQPHGQIGLGPAGGHLPCDGDSGAPIYWRGSVVGIHSGSSHRESPCDPNSDVGRAKSMWREDWFLDCARRSVADESRCLAPVALDCAAGVTCRAQAIEPLGEIGEAGPDLEPGTHAVLGAAGPFAIVRAAGARVAVEALPGMASSALVPAEELSAGDEGPVVSCESRDGCLSWTADNLERRRTRERAPSGSQRSLLVQYPVATAWAWPGDAVPRELRRAAEGPTGMRILGDGWRVVSPSE